MRQRWNDLLFAHWPIPPAQMAPHIPRGLELDTHDGHAWLGVVPFWMDQVRFRTLGAHTLSVPTASAFAELNLRTYVRSPRTGKRGVLFFALDCASPLAVLGARTVFQLPYFPARMRYQQTSAGLSYQSSRQLTTNSVRFDATYAPTGPVLPLNALPPNPLATFLTERYCLFTPFAGGILCGDIHHLPWPLQPAHADLRLNQLPAAHGLALPGIPPVLHLSKHLEVYIWGLRRDR